MGKDMRVDQLRRVVIVPGEPGHWRERNGKWYVCTETPVECLFLSSAIGATRFLPADGFISIVERLCAGEPWRAVSESELAIFLNLTVAEGVLRPEADLAIWVTVAHELSAQRGRADLHELLPELITDHDVLCEAERPTVPYSEKLQPATGKRFTGSLEEYQEQLFTTALSELGADDPMERRLRTYVQDVMFSRVASALD
ncbi:hypothetical protein ITI46_17600 [Streptomyces oryzae]|uniref:Uncharacterized protein n=1 Tax=Streptomyces oryzae TaxID=1434886 RepID=A0ABS3XDK1_9ACTN|nr:hypothetical protein [Streptomyces oryzae]MBO8193459.1 hypothetical protein [Streptomyces oryzae]